MGVGDGLARALVRLGLTASNPRPKNDRSRKAMPVEIVELPPTNVTSVAFPHHRTVPKAAAPQAETAPKKGIYVATPCYGCILNVNYLQSLLALQNACLERGVSCFVDFIGNESLVQRARNILAARFLQSAETNTHLLFIDADIGFDPSLVFRLLDFDRDVVTCIYPKKSIDWHGVRDAIDKGLNPRSNGLDFNLNIVGRNAVVENGFAEVLDSATGFMMISKTTLRRMAEHYEATLHCVNDIQGGGDNRVDTYVALFDCMLDPDSKRYLSEDYAFCRRWQLMGGKIWADVGTPLMHVGNYVYGGDIRQRQRITFSD